MADIELVIKIPEELKNKIDNANEDNYRTYIWWFDTTLYCAIKNGTLLPKGHGELIDRDKIEYLKAIHDAKYGHISWIDAIEKIKHSAPTIIEADKAESEDKE